jgi:hypothetical protein
MSQLFMLQLVQYKLVRPGVLIALFVGGEAGECDLFIKVQLKRDGTR